MQRIAGPRLLVGVGAGDSESRAEMETFGLPFGTEADRLTALRAALRVLRGRGYPVWVGGRARHVGLLAAEGADGWNRWGGSAEVFGRELTEVQGLVERLGQAPGLFTPSWGGLVLLGETDADAEKKAASRTVAPDVIVGGPERVADRLRPYVDAGARWIILGPLDSSDPDNARVIGEAVVPLLGLTVSGAGGGRRCRGRRPCRRRRSCRRPRPRAWPARRSPAPGAPRRCRGRRRRRSRR